jgi:hypothetical protein
MVTGACLRRRMVTGATYRISLRRAVGMEASQTVATSQTPTPARTVVHAHTVRSVGVQPGGHGWQDEFDMRTTLDARGVTRHGSVRDWSGNSGSQAGSGPERARAGFRVGVTTFDAGRVTKHCSQAHQPAIPARAPPMRRLR